MTRDSASYSYRQIWTVAYPILISIVMEQMIGITDTAFLGRVSETALGASTLAGIFYMIIFMIGFGFSIGSQIIIARRNGEGNYSETGTIFYHGIAFLAVTAVIIIGASEYLAPLILNYMIDSPQVLEASLDYIRWRAFGLIFAYTTGIFRAFFVGTTQTKTLTLNSVIMVLSNVAFNYILIFGKAGFPALGITGAAIGSTLAEGVSLLFFILYTWKQVDCRKYGLDRLPTFSWKTLGNILSVSIWTMIQNVISLSTWLIFFVYIEHLGERYLSISTIIRSTSNLLWMVMMAFAATCSSLVSNLIGNGHPHAVRSLVLRILKLSYGACALMIFIMVLEPEMVLGIFTDEMEVIKEAVPALWVICTSYLFTVPANVLHQAVCGTGNTRMAFFCELVSLGVYMFWCWLVIHVMESNVAICWTAEFAYGIPMVLMCGGYLLSGKWMGKQV